MDTPQRKNRQQLLLETLENILQIQATEVAETLNRASNLLIEALDADKVDVFLYHHDSATLIADGHSDTPLSRKQVALGLDRLPVANGGRTVEVFQTGERYLNGRIDQDIEVILGIREALAVRSMIVVPLEVGSERRGVVSVSSQQPDFYTAEDLSFLTAASRWVGSVLHQAELVEHLTSRAAEHTRKVVAEELVHILAHDLQNLLSPLFWRIDLIRRRAERERMDIYKRDATYALAAIQRLRAMINNLLDDTRLRQGVFALHPEPVNIADLVHQTINLFRGPGVDIQVNAPDEMTAQIDVERIRQALENLLHNAIKHTAPNTPIVITVSNTNHQDQPWITIAVRDQGPGIDPDILPHIFDRFATGPTSKGLGLGLYLVHQIAQAHGGELTVHSTLGVGTSFELSLPATADH